MRRTSTVLLTAVALGLAGCSSDSSGAGGTTTAQAAASTATSTGTSVSASTVATDSGSTSAELPGGSSGKAVLSAHHLLDGQGRIAPGPTAPKDKAVNAAICDYVFGTPSHVEETAKLSGTVTLYEKSGYLYNGGGGEGVQCIYQSAADTQVLMLTIWSDVATDTGGVTSFVQVSLHDGFQGVSAYAPKYKGRTMDKSTAEQWLKEAGSRVAHGSV